MTVIHPDGGLADAAATALTVAGPSGWLKMVKKMGLDYVMLVDDDGTVFMTRAMAKRVNWEGDKPENIVIAP